MQRHPKYLEKFIDIIVLIGLIVLLIAAVRGASEFLTDFFYH